MTMTNLDDIRKQIAAATEAIAKADTELKWELAASAADVAGMVDPTPTSDLIGAGLAIRKGDWFGAGMSVASMVPYVGDALAKPAKAVRAAKKINALRETLTKMTAKLADLKKAEKQAEAAEAAAKEAKIAKEAGEGAGSSSGKRAAGEQKASAKGDKDKDKDCKDCGSSGSKPTGNENGGDTKVADGAADTVKVFRVEGAGNQRLLIDEAGNVNIPKLLTNKGRGPERNLYLNFGDEARAQQFLEQRLQQFPDNTIKSFDVPKSFLDELRASAVPEAQRSLYPTRPVIADPTKAPDQFGLTAEQLQKLREVIVKGSGG